MPVFKVPSAGPMKHNFSTTDRTEAVIIDKVIEHRRSN